MRATRSASASPVAADSACSKVSNSSHRRSWWTSPHHDCSVQLRRANHELVLRRERSPPGVLDLGNFRDVVPAEGPKIRRPNSFVVHCPIDKPVLGADTSCDAHHRPNSPTRAVHDCQPVPSTRSCIAAVPAKIGNERHQDGNAGNQLNHRTSARAHNLLHAKQPFWQTHLNRFVG